MKFAYLALVPLLLAPESLLPTEFAAMAQQSRPGGSHGQGAKPPGGGSHGPGARPPGAGSNRPTNPGSGSNRPQPQPPRPGGNHVQPSRPGGGNQTRPPSQPGGNRPDRPGNHRPPAIKHPHRPGAGRPSTFRPMHAPGYRYPRGYGYRRWSIHMILPAIFLSSTYLFQDYAMIGVGPPPPATIGFATALTCCWWIAGPDGSWTLSIAHSIEESGRGAADYSSASMSFSSDSGLSVGA